MIIIKVLQMEYDKYLQMLKYYNTANELRYKKMDMR